MENSIVISSKKGRLGNPEEPDTKLIVFNLEDGQIIGVEEEISTGKDFNGLIKWFSYKRINEVYVSTIGNYLKQALNALGITVKQKEELTNDPFYNRFIFD